MNLVYVFVVIWIHTVEITEGQDWDDIARYSYGSDYGSDCIVETQDPPSYFLSFGLSEGDIDVPVNDDGSLGPISLIHDFNFFGQTFQSLWINTNGGVSFKDAIYEYVPQAFPLPEDYTMIVPYWTDIDTTRNDGRIYYRQSTDPSLLEGTSLSHLRTARDLALFVATWHNVTYFGGSECTKINTFQLVLVSQGSASYAIFNYGDMQWIVSSSTNAALAGFNAGENATFYELPSSMTTDMTALTASSNVRVPGQWVFRVDRIGAWTCEDFNEPIDISDSVYPALSACSPSLLGPVVEQQKYVTFFCEVKMSTDPNGGREAKAEVTFLFDGEEHRTMQSFEIGAGQAQVKLHEKYLAGNMGKNVGCKVVTFWEDTHSSRSPASYSNTYFVGIKVTASPVVVITGDDSSGITTLYSTIPITCPSAADDCFLEVTIRSSGNVLVTPGGTRQNLTPCKYRIYATDWSDNTQRATNTQTTVKFEMDRNVVPGAAGIGSVEFMGCFRDQKVDEYGNSYIDPWQARRRPGACSRFSVTLPDWYSSAAGSTEVYRTGNTKSAMCYSSGDPQMYTFDGLYYSIQQTGIFRLVRSSKFEVQVRHWACVEGRSGCSIVCAVAVRERHFAYGLDMCNSEKRLHRLLLSDKELDYRPITSESSRRQWMITMPSGAYVLVYVRTWDRGGMNVYVHVPPEYKYETDGLCGTYDEDSSNDMKRADGSYVALGNDAFRTWSSDKHDEINDFIEDWRLDTRESLFFTGPSEDETRDDPEEFCSCQLEDLNDNICNSRLTNGVGCFPLLPCQDMDSLIRPEDNALGRRKRSLRSDGVPGATTIHRRSRRSVPGPDYTDNVDHTYQLEPVEEDSANPVPTWPTWNNITESVATSYCQAVLANNTPASCQGFLTDADNQVVLDKCRTDIQITGDFSWALDKVTEVLNMCVQNIFTGNFTGEYSSDDLVAQLDAIAASACPEFCTGHGTCQNSICLCDSQYIGPDCSVGIDEAPVPLEILSPLLCDIQQQPCEKVTVLTDKLVNSDMFTCRIVGEQMDGSVFTNETRGLVTSYNEAECPLAALYSVDVGDGPKPFYRYNINLSNDGTVFSEPLSPSGSRSGAVVYDSTCIQCTDEGSCHKTENSCLIQGVCQADGELNSEDKCQECDPQDSTVDWSVLSDNSPPSLTTKRLVKIPKSILHASFSATDPEDHSVKFSSPESLAPGLRLTETGDFEWYSDVSTELTVHLEDECGAVALEVVQLVMGCSGCVSDRELELCMAHGADYRCDCPQGLAGLDCDMDIDECQSSPCVHGTCRDLTNRFSCECYRGYTGRLCDRKATVCDPTPCSNGASCVRLTDTTYSCTCHPYYTGTTCANYISEGTWASWSDYAQCSKSCDYGIKRRSRTCLRGNCDGPVEEKVLCNTRNCQEDPSQKGEGITFTMVGASVTEVALDVDVLINTTAAVVNDFCESSMEECCQAVNNRYSRTTSDAPFVNEQDVIIGRGYPQSGTKDQSVNVKVLIILSSKDLRKTCGDNAGTGTGRRKRGAAAGHYFDHTLLHSIISNNLHIFETVLDVQVEIDSQSSSDPQITYIAGIVGGLVFLAILAIVVVLVKTGKCKPRSNGKDTQKAMGPHALSQNAKAKLSRLSTPAGRPSTVGSISVQAAGPAGYTRSRAILVPGLSGPEPLEVPEDAVSTPALSTTSSVVGLGSLALLDEDDLSPLDSRQTGRLGSAGSSRMPVLQI